MVKILGMYFGAERQEKNLADKLYNHVVSAARNPVLYGDEGVPDTANGRFELIILHIFMLFRRLQEDDAHMRSVKQKTFDRFLEDMDLNLREIGVGPDGVPKRIQKMLENFYGRAEAYNTALDKGDDDLLSQTVARNIYSDAKVNETGANFLTQYILKAVKLLDIATVNELVNSEFKFSQD